MGEASTKAGREHTAAGEARHEELQQQDTSRKARQARMTCGPTGEGTKARAKEGSIVSARISSYLIDLSLHPFGAVHGRSCV